MRPKNGSVLSAFARSGPPPTERQILDRQLARSRYETLRNQVSGAETIMSLEKNHQGPTLEVLDLPSCPERPQISHTVILVFSGLAGLLIGALAGWLRRLRLTTASTPATIVAR